MTGQVNRAPMANQAEPDRGARGDRADREDARQAAPVASGSPSTGADDGGTAAADLARLAPALGRLHVLVDSEQLAAAALAGGAPTIQVRLKAGTDRERLAVIERIVARCAEARAQCLANDRVDLALAAGADGVHVGADDLPVAAVRRLATSRRFIIGGTTRDPATARRLVAEGATYLGVGPVYATASKDGLPDPLGLERLAEVVAAVDVPVIAIAGITAARVPAVLATGAWGVAVIGAVAGAPDPAAATAELRAAVAAAAATPAEPDGFLVPICAHSAQKRSKNRADDTAANS